ncbi:transglutaminase [Cohnella sp. CFH 77786]|uniref:transglutaminase-like domain-containing protein n=1 Tax=Cohnella sp. CFH 77786 TaxID=2662265 RepID=UPI001C60A9E1|nr:transglutaminase family protein [Cohnella sp. CFH 77786]MBW5446086.1 transglutaminase [Cohnella sp. CFH 77786]
MMLTCSTDSMQDYLAPTEEVDFLHPSIREKADEIFARSSDEIDFIRNAFEFVRDHVAHSWDLQSSRVTCKASDVLQYREGICYAKSNLLCGILRSRGIPAGFCYQKLTLGDTPDTGYCIHALNAVYIPSLGRWIRLDARGNKPGIDARFSLEEEKLAFPVRPEYEERDYPVIYHLPNPGTIETLKRHTDCITMYRQGLPAEL